MHLTLTTCGFCFFQESLSVDPEKSHIGEPTEGIRGGGCLGRDRGHLATVETFSAAVVAAECWLSTVLISWVCMPRSRRDRLVGTRPLPTLDCCHIAYADEGVNFLFV